MAEWEALEAKPGETEAAIEARIAVRDPIENAMFAVPADTLAGVECKLKVFADRHSIVPPGESLDELLAGAYEPVEGYHQLADGVLSIWADVARIARGA